MTPKLLLPNKYKKIGWVILIPSTVLGLVLCFRDFGADWLHLKTLVLANDATFDKKIYFTFTDVNFTNTLIGSAFIIGALLVSFSKEKDEDEYISELRLSSLLWAVLISYLLLLIAFLFVFGTPFLNVMVYNMFTLLIIFIARFNYLMYKNSKKPIDEK